MAQTDTHDGDLATFHQPLKMVDSILAVGRVAGSIGNEDAIEVVGDLMNRVVIGKARDGGAAADEAAKDVLFDTAVNDGDVCVA